VVLLHGLWFSHWALIPLARRLAGCGYRPLRYGWDTTGCVLEESAERLFTFVAALAEPRVHFVAHSLGGLLVRALLHAHPELPPGRVVTLGSPHGGSRTARVAASHRLLRPVLGRSVLQLVERVPETWRPPGREIGVIAGTRGVGLGRVFPGLERPNDGVVSLREARLEGAAAFRAVGVTHTGLIFSPRVAGWVAGFLEGGRFPD
jgi:pimeloyl-ACP methyl ester carboxylesterase